MSRTLPVARLMVLVMIATALGYIVERAPGRTTLAQPERGITVAVPANLEGWRINPGDGDVLVTGQTRSGLVSLEIVAIPVTENGEIDRFIEARHKELRAGKDEYIVWHQGTDHKFGSRWAPAYKATYQGKIAWWPWRTEIWQSDVYWPYRGQYVRISMRYPNFLINYVIPDRALIAASLKLEQNGGSK